MEAVNMRLESNFRGKHTYLSAVTRHLMNWLRGVSEPRVQEHMRLGCRSQGKERKL
jgi:hypothetical protein